MSAPGPQRCDVCGSCSVAPIDKTDDILGCHDCGYIFHGPRPAPDEIAAYYSRADKYDLWVKEEKVRGELWRRRLGKARAFKRSGTLLDVGAGTGQFLFYAGRYFDVFGTEVSTSAIKIAKDRYGIELLKGNLEDIDLAGRRFDLITLFHILEHVNSPSGLIEKCRELLNKDGVVIIAVPNEINSLASILKRPVKRALAALSVPAGKKYGARGLPKLDLKNSPDEIHLSYFTRGCLRRLLESRGFVVIDDSLDPHYASGGIRRYLDGLVYRACLAVKKVFGVNIYETIWIAAKKA